MTKKVKSISFNTKIEAEKEILKIVERRNFSKYVKTLIKKDIEDRKQIKEGKKANQNKLQRQYNQNQQSTPINPPLLPNTNKPKQIEMQRSSSNTN